MRQSCRFNRPLEIGQGRLEDVVVVVVNRNRALRLHDSQHLYPLLRIHREQDSKDFRPTQMQQRKLNLGIAPWDLL
jgi:hypothetical protein